MITAELFSHDNVKVQALDLHQLVRSEEKWLTEARRNTFDEYSTETLALEAIQRVLESRSLTGYVLRRDKEAVGIGTIVSRLEIMHPNPRLLGPWKLIGDQIDYWTEEMSVEEHKEATLALTRAARTPTMLGILSQAEEKRARGIREVMQKVGQCEPVRVLKDGRNYHFPQMLGSFQVYTYVRPKS